MRKGDQLFMDTPVAIADLCEVIREELERKKGGVEVTLHLRIDGDAYA